MDSMSSDPKSSAFESFIVFSIVGDSVQRTAMRSTQSSSIEPATSLQAALACSISHADWCSPAPHGGTVYRLTVAVRLHLSSGCWNSCTVSAATPFASLSIRGTLRFACGVGGSLRPVGVAAAGVANYQDFMVTRQQVKRYILPHVA